jgi:hypothetical protein
MFKKKTSSGKETHFNSLSKEEKISSVDARSLIHKATLNE